MNEIWGDVFPYYFAMFVAFLAGLVLGVIIGFYG